MGADPVFAPWPWGLALGVVLGVVAAGAGPAATVAAWGVAVAVAILALRWPASDEWGRRALALALALGLAGGAWRASATAAAPDPWAGRSGAWIEVEAVVVDGVAWPSPTGGPGLLLRGAAPPDGRHRLTGHLEAIAGRRNPGGFDARAHHARHGVTATLQVASSVALAPPGARLRARAALRAGVTAGLPPTSAALMQALTLGLRDDLGPLREAFAASGLAHVLALSGLHVGLLAAVLVRLVGGVGRRRAIGVVAVLIGYVAVVGPSPAVVRATAMVGVALLSRAFGVGGAGWGSHLSLAAAASLIARPAWLGDLGFQLSYLSVLGIGLVAQPLAARWSGRAERSGRAGTAGAGTAGAGTAGGGTAGGAARAGAWLRGALALGIGAQWATGSLVASTFGGIPVVAPLANLVGVPLASALVPLGFAAGLLGLLHEGAAAALNRLTALPAAALLHLAEGAARAPGLPWGEVSPTGHAAFALGSVALLAGLRGVWRPWRAATAAFAAGMVTVVVPPAWAPPDLVALDVGQGDAVVVRVARGQAVLVDGGGTPFSDFDVGARVVVPALRALGVGALPLVVATHADVDHIEGLAAVLRSFPVGLLLIGHPAPERRAFVELMAAADERGVPVVEARRGETYRVGDLELDVLHPTHRPTGDANDDSVALALRWRGGPWALLLGDVSATVEASLPVPPTPLLLAPHHGSGSSSSEALVRAARPAWAWVSVGRNRYGHPAASVLERFAAHGVAVRTTLDEGALRAPYPLPPPPAPRPRRPPRAAARRAIVRGERVSVRQWSRRFVCCPSGVSCASSWRAGTTDWSSSSA